MDQPGLPTLIADIVRAIAPIDQLEAEHLHATLTWIESGAPLFRTQKPATPSPHLVAYFVLFDPRQQQVLLVDHKAAGLWLPSGGHVEPGEHPRTTVTRELREELYLDAHFYQDAPLFLTVTETIGAGTRHTDVSLWYVLQGDSAVTPAYDPTEFHGVAWFPLDGLPFSRTDPHLARFVAKLQSLKFSTTPYS